ncbi:MAG: fatty acyl-AMP ligase [Cyanobacteria bacterium P01_G01_bin.38]
MTLSIRPNAQKALVSAPLPEGTSTFVDILCYRAQTCPQQLAYTFLQGEDEIGSLTYGELDLRVRAMAAFLQSKLPRGCRVLLAYQPGLDFVLAFLSCLYAGVVAVPAYSPRRNQKTSRLRSIVANAEIEFALTTSQLQPSFQHFCGSDSVLSGLRWLVTDQVDQSLSHQWQYPDVSPDALAFLQYTSGSTGDPKGVMVSHANLLHNSSVIADCFGHDAESQGVIWLPPYHDMGLIGGVLQPLYIGFPVCLMSPVDFLQKPLRWLRAVSRYRATTSGGPNFAYDLAVRKATPEKLAALDLDLSSWEVAFTGAEPIRAETLDRFAEVFEPYGFRREAFYPCYGMAESTLIISGGEKLTPPTVRHVSADALEQGHVEHIGFDRSDARAVVSCGRSVSGQTVMIVNTDSLLRCPEGRVGEIWVSGGSVAQGYWNQAKETEAYFRACLAETGAEAEKGYFMRTGDLGFVDGEDLFVTGRLKDLIIIRGQNHYPQDIELTVEKSHLALRSNAGAAFSVELKQAERLIIVHEVERSYLRQLNAEEILKSIRQAVTTHHALEAYAIALVKTGSIPKTSSGKIRRRACRDAFLNGDLNVVADWSRDTRRKATFQSLQHQIDSIFQQIGQKDMGQSDG